MNIESIRDYCLSLPRVTEDFPFDETTLVFRIAGKIFAMIDLDNTEWFVLKCDPEYAIDLREKYQEISGAWHMNKKYWNQINIFGSISDNLICHLICHSYNEQHDTTNRISFDSKTTSMSFCYTRNNNLNSATL